MTKNRLTNKLRQNHYYKPLIEALADLQITEYEIISKKGGGHPILALVINGENHRMPLPNTPSGYSDAANYVVARLRRRVREARERQFRLPLDEARKVGPQKERPARG
jgi:hypothetical protein